MAGWVRVNKCNGCGHVACVDARSYASPREPCPGCGQIDWIEDLVARQVIDKKGIWWNPFSWDTHKWQFLEKPTDTP